MRRPPERLKSVTEEAREYDRRQIRPRPYVVAIRLSEVELRMLQNAAYPGESRAGYFRRVSGIETATPVSTHERTHQEVKGRMAYNRDSFRKALLKLGFEKDDVQLIVAEAPSHFDVVA